MTESAVEFPKDLADRISEGLQHGLTDEEMVKGMISVGNLMAKFVKPDSPSEALIKEMWEVADSREKEMLAGLVLRMGKKYIH